jgi:hypothetical protein
MPPAPTVFDQGVIVVGAIGDQHVGNGTPALVEAVSLERNLLRIDEC